MVKTVPKSMIEQITDELQAILGSNLHMILTYGSIYQPHYHPEASDINLLIILKNTADLPATRKQLAAWWPKQPDRDQIKSKPRVSTHRAIQSYLQLQPIFLKHLKQHGRSHTKGANLVNKTISLEMPTHTHLINQAFHTSHDITSQNPSPALTRLIHKLRKTAEPPTQTPTRQLNNIWQTTFNQPVTAPNLSHTTPPSPPPYVIENLVTLYNKLDILIVVIASPIDLFLTNWAAVWQQAKTEGYTELKITTPDQFHLILEHYGALDVRLLSYDHVWGADLISHIKPSISAICYAAARYASDLQFRYFSDHYFYEPVIPGTWSKTYPRFAKQVAQCSPTKRDSF